jgi:hypothetical protein
MWLASHLIEKKQLWQSASSCTICQRRSIYVNSNPSAAGWLGKAVLVLRAPDKFVEFTGLNEEFPKGWGFTKGDVVKTHEEVVMVVSAKQGEQSTFERFSVHASRNHTANRSIFR